MLFFQLLVGTADKLPLSVRSTPDSIEAQESIAITNASFEADTIKTDHWDNIPGWTGQDGSISNDSYYAPLDGEFYAVQQGQCDWVTQETATVIEAGKSYTMKAWVRSINEAENSAKTLAEIGFFTENTKIISEETAVNAPQLKGAAATHPNDDGANVWIDQGYRHQFSDVHMVQPLDRDPLKDPWNLVENSG